jgi:hypothetical protein
MGPIRCIQGPQIAFQVPNIVIIEILLSFTVSFDLNSQIIIINYLMHVCKLFLSPMTHCGVFYTGGWALF